MSGDALARREDEHVQLVAPRRLVAQRLRSLRERQLALVVLCTGALVIILDSSVVNVALPSIQEGLGFSQSNLAWVVNAYVIPFGGLLLFAGRLGDLAGRKRMFLGGLGLFTVASLFCGLAQSQQMLVAARFAQGVGGAFASAVVLGMIATMFPKPREQAKAISVYAFVAAAGAAIGLLMGAALTEAINWHWIFFVNLPIGVVTIICASRLLDPNERVDPDDGTDVPGAVLITASLMVAVYTIVQVPQHGWGSARTLLLAAAALVLFVGFVGWQARARHPLVPLTLFRDRNLGWANLVQVLLVAGLVGMFFLGALYMQLVLDYGVMQVGLAFLPVAVAIGTMSIKAAPKLVEHVDAKTVLAAGLVLIAAGLLLFARLPVDGAYVVDILPVMLLIGVGSGLCFPAVLTIAIAGATPSDAGVRSGLVTTTQQVGSALGLAVLAAVSSDRTASLLLGGDAPADALVGGYRTAFLVGAALVVVALLLTLAVVRPAVPKTAPDALDHATVDDSDLHVDMRGVRDPDLLALGMGGTNMMAMLWTVAAGRRAVGVEMRGDPAYGVMHWNIREDLYHHLGVIDQMMLERYGEDRIPRRGDGSLFLLSECLYSSETAAGDATADEVVFGFDLESHVGGLVRYTESIDDRWKDGAPHRVVTATGAITPPGRPDAGRIGARMVDVLEQPSTFQAGAEETLILLRRYLELIERQDLDSGVEPRVRLFTHHRVVDEEHDGFVSWRRLFSRRDDGSGFHDAPGGRKRVRIEAVRGLDHKGKYRRLRIPGTEPIDLGVPELFVIAQGIDSRDAERLGFTQEVVRIDHGDGRGPVPAQADYLAGLIEVWVDSRLRRRIASEFDKEGNEYWVRQIAVGHEDDSEVGWVLVQVPEFKTFDPILAGLVPPGTDRDSAEYYAAVQHLLRDYFVEQTSHLFELPKRELAKVQLTYGPKLFSLVERVGADALVAANGVVAGDSFGNGHYLTSGGAMTGMVGHGSRVLRYWQARDAGVSQPEAIRRLADGIKEDTDGWLTVSAKEFDQPVRTGQRTTPASGAAPHLQRIAGTTGQAWTEHATTLEATRRHRHFLLPPNHSDEWTRVVIQAGRLHAYPLPPPQPTHPAQRAEGADREREPLGAGTAGAQRGVH